MYNNKKECQSTSNPISPLEEEVKNARSMVGISLAIGRHVSKTFTPYFGDKLMHSICEDLRETKKKQPDSIIPASPWELCVWEGVFYSAKYLSLYYSLAGIIEKIS